MVKRSTSLLAAVVLLWLLFAQMMFEARLTSLTTDEPLHIISGYSYLKTGDARLVEEHPLLIKAIAAWPLLLSPDLGDPRQARGWSEGSLVLVMRAMLTDDPALERVTFASRVPIMWLGLILAALVYRWAADWRSAGPKAGLIALGLCALDPNIVAHTQLATTDLGVTLFLLVTWYFLWQWIRRPSQERLGLTGIALGLALASKMSSLIAVPVILLVVCVTFAKRQPHGWRGALRLVGQAILSFAVILAIAALTVWAVYGFELRWLPHLPIPIPAASHLIPLARLFEHQRAGHSTFVWGRNSQMGWWYYFPVAFALKTPLPTLILMTVAVASILSLAIQLWKKKQPGPLEQLIGGTALLISFPVIYFVSAMLSTVDLGYRHLLPVLPFVFILAAQIVAFKFDVSNFKLQLGRLILSGLIAWYVISAALTFPRPLEFFNELAGSSANGYTYLVDSNLDWGQSFKELKNYLGQRGVNEIKLSAFSFFELSGYGLNYEPLPPSHKAPEQFPSFFNPAPGVYAIGATSLQGVATPDINTYAFFRTMQPTARIGQGMFIYDIRQAKPGSWVAQCASPIAPLEPAEIQAGFGRDDLRRVYFDCSQSWWYPSSGLPGWYVDSPGRSLDRAIWYSGAQTIFRARTADGKPRFEIAHVAHPALPTGLTTAVRTVQGNAIAAPVKTTGPLTFEGYWLLDNATLVQPDSQVVVLTAWRVTTVPTQPVSIMAHLVDASGHLIANGDGLGVPPEVWQVGDQIIQTHRLSLPQDAGAETYRVETGTYTLTDLKRFTFTSSGEPAGDRLVLTEIQVKP